MLYENGIDAIKLNKTIQAQILQIGKNKGDLKKEVVILKREISRNSTTQSELEQLKRRVRMLNSGTTSSVWRSLLRYVKVLETRRDHSGVKLLYG